MDLTKYLNYIKRPAKIFIALDNICKLRLIWIKSIYQFPSILPSTFVWKFLPCKWRFDFYNRLFINFPVGPKLIRTFASEQHLPTSTSSLDKIYTRSGVVDLEKLCVEGYFVLPNVIASSHYFNFCEAFLSSCSFSKSRNFSYNEKTSFHLFGSRGVSQIDSFSPVLSVVKQVSQALFGNVQYPEYGAQCIKALGDDTNDPNTIPHIDRFVPCLKAFYFPFDVDENGAPFAFAPGSHIISEAYRSYYINTLRSRLSSDFPFTMPSQFMKEHSLKTFPVPGNTLVFAFTNGLHCRTAFKSFPSERWSVVFDWYNSLTKINALTSKSPSKSLHSFLLN